MIPQEMHTSQKRLKMQGLILLLGMSPCPDLHDKQHEDCPRSREKQLAQYALKCLETKTPSLIWFSGANPVLDTSKAKMNSCHLSDLRF